MQEECCMDTPFTEPRGTIETTVGWPAGWNSRNGAYKFRVHEWAMRDTNPRIAGRNRCQNDGVMWPLVVIRRFIGEFLL